MKKFTVNGVYHTVDNAGNHFIGDRCVNPLEDSNEPIGSTIPHEKDRVPSPLITGKAPTNVGSDVG